MKSVLSHQDSRFKHPIRTLLFVTLVIMIAMLVSASTHRAPVPDHSDIFLLVAQEGIDGEEVFDRVCATCHSIDRPTDSETEPLAPPMRMIAKRYLMKTESAEAARHRIVQWLEGPDAEKSLMPAMAIEHHGLMPPVVLTEVERTAVADYVMSLTEGMEPGMMKGEQGQGMMKGRMQDGQQGQGMMKGDMQDGQQGQGMMKGRMNGEMKGQMKGHKNGCDHKTTGAENNQEKGCKHHNKANGNM